MNNRFFTTRRLALTGIFAGIALALHVVEGFLPPVLPLPGVKLGFSNTITLLLMIWGHPLEALVVLVLRILIGSLFFSQATAFLYSLAGGISCYLVMHTIGKLLKNRYPILISIFGALTHNVAQLLVALLLTGSPGILVYAPVLILSATGAGLITGLAAQFTLPYIRRIRF